MFKNILVAMEALRPDHPAFVTAQADFPEAKLHLLHVIAPLAAAPISTLAPMPLIDMSYELDEQARARQEMQALGDGEVVISPLPAAEILRLAGTGEFDLILLATSTKSDLERLVLGSVAATVVSEAPIPVMTVSKRPPAHAARPPLQVLVLQDFSAPARHAVEIVRQHFPDAQIDLLHVVPHGTIDPTSVISGARRGMTSGLLAQRRQVWVAESETRLAEMGGGEIVEGDPAEVALERARNGQYQLIAMGTSSKGILENLFFGSVARRVVQDSPIPVLTVHEQAAPPQRQPGIA